MDADKIASFVKEQLFRKNMNVADAVRKSNIGSYTFHAVIQGKAKNPRINTLEEVASVLGLSLVDLLLQNEGVKKEQEPSPTIKKFQGKEWKGRIYAESARILDQVLKKFQTTFQHQDAVELLEEIYDFHCQSNKENIDFTFVEWIAKKYIEKINKLSANDNQGNLSQQAR